MYYCGCVVYLWDLKPAKKWRWLQYGYPYLFAYFLSSNLYFLKFHYDVIVILAWLIIFNWIWFIYITFVVSITILYNDISLFPTHKTKRERLLMILFCLDLVEFSPLVKINRQIDRLEVGLTRCVTVIYRMKS